MRKARRVAVKDPESPILLRKLTKPGFGYQVPPELSAVIIYFDQKDSRDQAKPFFNHYDDNGWLTPKGAKIRNWKVLATDWIYNYQQNEKLRQRLVSNSRFL